MKYCTECGEPLEPGKKFCTSCGAPVTEGGTEPPGAPEVTAGPPAGKRPPKKRPPRQKKEKKEKKEKERSFFSSPAGIIVIILIVLVVAGGGVAAFIFLTGDSDAAYREGVAEVWNEFEGSVSAIDKKVPPVEDLTTLASADLITSFQKTMEKNRKEVGAISRKLEELTPSDEYKKSNDHLTQALKDYDSYLEELDSFYTVYLVDPNNGQLDKMLEKMTNLAQAVKIHVDDFLKGNDAVKPTTFDPAVLALPSGYKTQLVVVRQAIEEQDRKEAEEQAAAAAAEAAGQAQAVLSKWLDIYISQGWFDGIEVMRPYMTSRFYNDIHQGKIPGYSEWYAVAASISSHRVVNENNVVFTVRLTCDDDYGSQWTDNWKYEVVRSGGQWLVNDMSM